MTSLFKPNIPPPPKPARMADPQSPEVLEARRRAAMQVLSRGGRGSTILSQARPSDEYASSRLGEA